MLKSSGFFTDQDKANAANAFEHATKTLVEKKARENLRKEEEKNRPKYDQPRDVFIKDKSSGLREDKPKAEKKEDSDDEYDYLLEQDDDEELRSLREKRLQQLKEANSKKMELVNTRQHTKYVEIAEGDFLDAVLKSKYCVCHFFHKDFERCKIVDKHLGILCQKYWQTRFVKINAEKTPFFVTKLQVRVLPSIILFKDGVAVDRIVGFEELGGKDDFPTVAMEKRLLMSKTVGTDLEL
ncbi:hypothetical protein FDP41_011278 [Naegleria fowleri]|uniref:Thioredoxin domain-containing protein n=1 Tax=Naegleria fowleri TaxID=5763 RepID=A0A6A5C9H6_NAEFO|nr:uncharacterized protein FDP41_011278 [Naegleria fowleri]KAF0982348.1 hypothetical protein FDP41_011278 [Naegleria fowleri]CAG4708329.1 unnamed protein product [Naegleria fowleri]